MGPMTKHVDSGGLLLQPLAQLVEQSRRVFSMALMACAAKFVSNSIFVDEASGQYSQWGCPLCMRLAQERLLVCGRIMDQRPAVSVADTRPKPDIFGHFAVLLHGGVHFVMFPECIPVATLDRAIVPKWGANAKRVHEPKGNSEPRRADRLRVPMGRHPRLHHSTAATRTRSIRDRGCTHGPRHETGHAVPESNPKSRVGRRRAVARRADQGYPAKFDFGVPASAEDIATVGIAIRPDGQGLPAGKGDYAMNAEHVARCG